MQRFARADLAITIRRHREGEREHPIAGEPGVDGEEVGETPEQESGAAEQDDRQSDLGDDERGGRAPHSGAGGHASGRGEPARGVVTAEAEAREEAERHRRHQRDCDGKEQYRAIEADVAGSGEIDRGRHQADERRRRPPRAQQCGRTGNACQRDAFGEQLQHDLAAPRTECNADRHFLPPSQRPGDEKIRDVRARDQQHQANRTEQQHQSRPCLADPRIAERHGEVLRALILCWMLLRHLL